MNGRFLLSLLCSLLLLYSCSDDRSGATSETTNGVAVITPDGSPAENVAVFVRKSNKLLSADEEPQEVHGHTNEKGYFIIDSALQVDNYIIELTDSNGFGTQVTPDTMNGELVLPDTIKLEKQGLLLGSVTSLSGITGDEYRGQDISVQIYGLDRITQTDSNGIFRFNNLPTGDIRIHIVTPTKDTVAESDKYVIYPDDTTNTGNYIIGGTLEDELKLIEHLFELNNLEDSLIKDHIQIKNNHIVDIFLDSMGIDTLIPELGYLRLKTFSCARNNIKSIPKEFGNLVDLYYIDLSYNEIQYLPDEFGNLQSCTEMDLEYNKLRAIPLTFIQDNKLKHLDKIHVRGNCLTNEPHGVEFWLDKYSWHKSWRDYQEEWSE